MRQPEKADSIIPAAETAETPVAANSNNAVALPPEVKPAIEGNFEACSTQDAVTPVEPPAAEKPGLSRRKKALAIAFNIAAGAGAAAAAKIGTTMLLATVAVPAAVTLVASSIAVGAAGSAVSYAIKNKTMKGFFAKENRKQNFKTFLMSTGFSFIGGAIYTGFSEGYFQSAYNSLFGATPAVADVPAVVAAPPVLTATEKFAAAVAGQDVAVEVKEAMARTASDSARVSAQATKDLAYYTFNGLEGVAKDQPLAVELFKKAAEAGSVQAKIDLAYIQYHGLAGVPVDKQAALAAVQEIKTAKAEMFAREWGKVVKSAVTQAISTPKA